MPVPVRWVCVWCGWCPEEREDSLYGWEDYLYEVEKHEAGCVHNPANMELFQLEKFIKPTP